MKSTFAFVFLRGTYHFLQPIVRRFARELHGAPAPVAEFVTNPSRSFRFNGTSVGMAASHCAAAKYRAPEGFAATNKGVVAVLALRLLPDTRAVIPFQHHLLEF